ncbi:hypothetical protein [Tichowtungia aerotolerans]|uniref:Autotransporter outer membrane beta-barrel domain-containing protein n=1 Tax=Tichowtungia aerotolerans TaxID=2697043 RepID=A0A6P1M5K0_9BACT|nr:hypothetical protein [Tichowtungia aerotolerans]QHI69322.1 hypothetical protein GT409_07610 [Tichowtungia aerotolerans]
MNTMTAIKIWTLAIIAGFVVQANAIETRFNTGGSWTNAANWSEGVPTINDLARLQNPVVADIDSVEVIGGLNFRGDVNLGESIININNGGSLTSDGTQFAGINRIGSDGDATLNINDGGTVNFSGTAAFEVGENSSDSGYVNVNTGGVLQVSQVTHLGTDSGCVGNLTVAGGAATFSDSLLVGNSLGGTGVVTITSGTLTINTVLQMAYSSDAAVGIVEMSGGTLFHNNGTMLVGRKGVANFNQSGGEVNAKDIVVGNMAGGNGAMNISGGTNLLSGAMTLARVDGAVGALNMSGGSMIVSSMLVGKELGSVGTLTLSGADTYLKASSLSLGDVGASVSSSIVVNDGTFQVHAIQSDSNSAEESIHVAGGVLKLRHISGATGFDDAVALIDAGVLTWDKGALGTLASTIDPATATMSWTNESGIVLYADTNTNNTHYYYMWAEAEMPVPTFSDWSTDFGMTSNNTYADDFDGDFLSNLAEYALGSNPTDAADAGAVSAVNGENFLYIYNRRTDAVDRGLTYEMQNADLLSSGTWTNEYVEVGTSAPFTDALGDEFETVTNSISMSGKDMGFAKLKITISE